MPMLAELNVTKIGTWKDRAGVVVWNDTDDVAWASSISHAVLSKKPSAARFETRPNCDNTGVNACPAADFRSASTVSTAIARFSRSNRCMSRALRRLVC